MRYEYISQDVIFNHVTTSFINHEIYFSDVGLKSLISEDCICSLPRYSNPYYQQDETTSVSLMNYIIRGYNEIEYQTFDSYLITTPIYLLNDIMRIIIFMSYNLFYTDDNKSDDPIGIYSREDSNKITDTELPLYFKNAIKFLNNIGKLQVALYYVFNPNSNNWICSTYTSHNFVWFCVNYFEIDPWFGLHSASLLFKNDNINLLELCIEVENLCDKDKLSSQHHIDDENDKKECCWGEKSLLTPTSERKL